MADRNGSRAESAGTSSRDGSTAPAPETVLFVCRHGAAKSVLAAADFRTLAAERGLNVEAVAAGLEPDAEIAPVLIDALDFHGLREGSPRAVKPADLATASRVITFDLAPDELLIASTPVERWDDIPSVSEHMSAARDAIRHRLARLIGHLLESDPG
jgi:arsenate reductase (thioredoxin)